MGRPFIVDVIDLQRWLKTVNSLLAAFRLDGSVLIFEKAEVFPITGFSFFGSIKFN